MVKDGDLQRYLMFYEAVAADGTRSIGLAASQDGISGWQRLDRRVCSDVLSFYFCHGQMASLGQRLQRAACVAGSCESHSEYVWSCASACFD